MTDRERRISSALRAGFSREQAEGLADSFDSFPDSFDWAGATKAQRGQMIANAWPISMATAVCKAMLIQLAREKGIAA